MITLGHHGLMMRSVAQEPVLPADAPPGNWEPLMESSRWLIAGLFSDPCSGTDWSFVTPWEPYPGNLGGIEKAGSPSSATCRLGFSVYAQGSFFNTFRPSRILIGVRRNSEGSIGANAYFAPGTGRPVYASSVLDSGDTSLVFDATVWDSNLNRMFIYVNGIVGGSSNPVSSVYLTYIGYEN